MSIADRLADHGHHAPERPARRRKAYPDGWQPRSDVDETDGGTITSKPYAVDPSRPAASEHPDTDTIVAEFGYDPARWHVSKIRRSRWQQREGGEWLEAVQLHVVPAGVAVDERQDVEAMLREIARWRPPKRDPKTTRGAGVFAQPVGDLQLGKPDGDGTAGTIRRTLAGIAEGVERARWLTRAKVPLSGVLLPWLGDCIEGTQSQGGRLVMRLELTSTQQVRAYRRLMWRQVKAYAGLFDRITIPVVPGNHDEAQRIGNAMATTYDDSWAIEGACAVADAVAENDALAERVRFVLPEHDELTITLDVAGVTTGFAHGHQFGKDPFTWWDRQAGGRQPIGDADILLAAHLHHLHTREHGDGRYFVQIPALDGGSTHYRHKQGASVPPGMVSLVIGGGEMWSHFDRHRCRTTDGADTVGGILAA